MIYVNNVVGGFLWGVGLVTAVAMMEHLFHWGLCR